MRQSFHHGNLRAVLLEQAEAMLREDGVDGLSLRELARRAEVSHGAPRSHFVDRQALLDALAVQGFERMTEKISAALRSPGTVRERFRRVGRAYVDFAVDDAALMELMFAAKSNSADGPVNHAAVRLFTLLDDAMADSPSSTGDDRTRERFKLMFAAAMQGTAALITSQRITREQGEVLVDDATDALLASKLSAGLLVNEA
ncbi:TetR/AcrR family transcriptional regulator [Actinoplanes sp. N902-109]|uniref:TetR/AcrR family transcriptional regulator n=1 Tax=Actinoplanes sp. (strain N902-109) TaxID=649831 RepID=UPI0003293F81|nr:TetR/AcrR family transcriptional regulator [Actinoplanes sp. N902-109]AGL20969.1 TetR family transcriptional regulator [Actinoplanes sp. N902-109]